MNFGGIKGKPGPDLPPNIVSHPRFGDKPHVSTEYVPIEAWSVWWYDRSKLFPTSAINAIREKQNYTSVAVDFYADSLEVCVDCDRPFIFFAVEQMHWYEELGFTLDAQCIRCIECRKEDQQLRFHFQRFSGAIVRDDLSDEELATLINDAVFLWDCGILVKEDKLRRLKNVARVRIPNEPATIAILERITRGPEPSRTLHKDRHPGSR